jgi:hypothetical protein
MSIVNENGRRCFRIRDGESVVSFDEFLSDAMFICRASSARVGTGYVRDEALSFSLFAAWKCYRRAVGDGWTVLDLSFFGEWLRRSIRKSFARERRPKFGGRSVRGVRWVDAASGSDGRTVFDRVGVEVKSGRVEASDFLMWASAVVVEQWGPSSVEAAVVKAVFVDGLSTDEAASSLGIWSSRVSLAKSRIVALLRETWPHAEQWEMSPALNALVAKLGYRRAARAEAESAVGRRWRLVDENRRRNREQTAAGYRRRLGRSGDDKRDRRRREFKHLRSPNGVTHEG